MPELYMPTITTFAAGLQGIVFTALSLMVVAERSRTRVNLGSGETPEAASPDARATKLYMAVRAHGNFAEYVPLILVLTALIEIHTGPTLLVKCLAFGLVLARLLHPIGIRMKAFNPYRSAGFVLTMVILAVASGKLIMLALG